MRLQRKLRLDGISDSGSKGFVQLLYQGVPYNFRASTLGGYGIDPAENLRGKELFVFLTSSDNQDSHLREGETRINARKEIHLEERNYPIGRAHHRTICTALFNDFELPVTKKQYDSLGSVPQSHKFTYKLSIKAPKASRALVKV